MELKTIGKISLTAIFLLLFLFPYHCYAFDDGDTVNW